MWMGTGDIWSINKIENLHLHIEQDMHMSVQIYKKNAYNCDLFSHKNCKFHILGELGVKS